MLDEAQLRSEYSYNGFRSYYSHRIAAEYRSYAFYGGEREFKELINAVLTGGGHFSFPCFGDFQNCIKRSIILKGGNNDSRQLNEDYELYIVINTKRDRMRAVYQYCWMSTEELIDHINIVKSLFDGFEFSVLKDQENGFMKVKFLFKKDSITYFQIRFLLTWMRYSYEWAISVSTMDAYRLYNNPEYLPELSKEDIFNLVQITNKLTYPYVLSDQVIDRKGVPLPFNKFKERVNKSGNRSLCDDIYLRSVDHERFPFISGDPDAINRVKIDSKRFYSLAWWEDEDSFVNERLPLYKQYVKILKTQYDYEPAK